MHINMKVCLVLSALVAASLALPATPSGPASATAPAAAAPAWRPSGRLLLLPARLENPTPAGNNNNATKTQQTQSDESQPARLLDSGEYYVLLPDGRLQMVKYTTAALTAAESGKQASGAAAESQLPARVQAAEPFSQFQIEYFQFPSQVSQLESEQAEEESAQVKAEKEEESGFEANVQYRDVKPISGPIYAYNPNPLVRIVRSQEY